MVPWDHWAVRRLLLVLAVSGFVTLVVVLTVLATGDVKTSSADPVSCGSLLSRAEPDPTAEDEHGCGDLFLERGQDLVVTAAFGGGLVAAVALGAVAQAAAARATASSNTRDDSPRL